MKKKLFINMNPIEKLDYLYKNHIIKNITIKKDDQNNAILEIEFDGLKMKKSEFQLIMDKLDVITVDVTDLKKDVSKVNKVVIKLKKDMSIVKTDISDIKERLDKLECEARAHN